MCPSLTSIWLMLMSLLSMIWEPYSDRGPASATGCRSAVLSRMPVDPCTMGHADESSTVRPMGEGEGACVPAMVEASPPLPPWSSLLLPSRHRLASRSRVMVVPSGSTCASSPAPVMVVDVAVDISLPPRDQSVAL